MDIEKIKYLYISHSDIIDLLPNLTKWGYKTIDCSKYKYFCTDTNNFSQKKLIELNIPFISIAYLIRENINNLDYDICYAYSVRSEYDTFVKSKGRDLANDRLFKLINNENSKYSGIGSLIRGIRNNILPGVIDIRYVGKYPQVLGYKLVNHITTLFVIENYFRTLSDKSLYSKNNTELSETITNKFYNGSDINPNNNYSEYNNTSGYVKE